MKICYKPKRFIPAHRDMINKANAIIEEYAAQGFELTLRQLYYQFVSRDLLPNTLQSYKALGSILNDARLAGLVDWEAIVDRTRFVRSQAHWDDPAQIVRACANQFRVDMWQEQPNHVEVWIEKDALVGVIEGVCNDYDVPFFSCRGYTSQSELWASARRLAAIKESKDGKCVVVHLGDHDPSGIDMTRDIRERLEMFGADVEVRRVALNMPQVEHFNPPPNPAKTTDSRASSYIREHGTESWELDALEPAEIVAIITRQIEGLRDLSRWNADRIRQEAHRTELAKVSQNWEEITSNL